MVPGSILAGKYELIEPIGQGGMGTVWRANREGWQAQVAVKLIHASLARRPGVVARFRQEAGVAAKLRGPHVVQILDDGVDPESGAPFIVMELLAGETLARRLDRVGRLALPDTARIITQVCRAVSLAHEHGVVHRDLKPDNVFLVRERGEEVVKVVDFGVAKWSVESFSQHALTSSGSLLGTPFYMSPEQLTDSSKVDARSDLWSLAIMTFECVTGQRPFDSDSMLALAFQICNGPRPVPSLLVPVAPQFDVWFARGAALDVAARFQSAEELAAALARVCDAPDPRAAAVEKTLPSPALRPSAPSVPSAPSIHPVASTQREQRQSRGSRLGLVTLALLGLGALVAVSWLKATPAPSPTKAASAAPAEVPAELPAPAPEPAPTGAAPEPAAPAALSAPVAPPVATEPAARAAQPSVTHAAQSAAPRPRPSAKPAATWDESFERKPAPAPTWNPIFD